MLFYYLLPSLLSFALSQLSSPLSYSSFSPLKIFQKPTTCQVKKTSNIISSPMNASPPHSLFLAPCLSMSRCLSFW